MCVCVCVEVYLIFGQRSPGAKGLEAIHRIDHWKGNFFWVTEVEL